MASSANRHPVVLLGAAASLITVLGFFGVRGWPGSEPPVPAASTQPATPSLAPVRSSAPATVASSDPTCACPAPTPSRTATTVSCVIEDRLGEGQAAETVTLRFGSKEWELTVDESDPTDRLTLRFPRSGTYPYAVTTETETFDGDVVHGTGAGTLGCRGGQTFQIVGNYDSDPLTVSLEEA